MHSTLIRRDQFDLRCFEPFMAHRNLHVGARDSWGCIEPTFSSTGLRDMKREHRPFG